MMAPKSKKFYEGESKDMKSPFASSDSEVGGVFSSMNSRKMVDQIHSGDSGDYPDTMEAVDAALKKNSNWKLNK